MLNQTQFDQICIFTRKYLKETVATSKQEWVRRFPRAAEHRWQHTLNVLRNAERILAGEGAADDVADVVRVAAVLHDVSMFVCDHSIHGRVSANIAEKYLCDCGYSEEFVACVAQAIDEHGTDFGPLPPEEQGALFSWEGKVVVEADILDKLGAQRHCQRSAVPGPAGEARPRVPRGPGRGSDHEAGRFLQGLSVDGDGQAAGGRAVWVLCRVSGAVGG